MEKYSKYFITITLFVITAIFSGYTLLPVPRNLELLFLNSNIFKFLVLLLIAIINLKIHTWQEFIITSISIIIILTMFELLR